MPTDVTLLNMIDYGPVLATRARGREAADRIQDMLQGGNLLISFGQVEVATPSFLDEVLIRLRAVLQANEQAIAVVANTNDDVRESLELVVHHRGMVLGEVQDGHIRLLGGRQHLQETLSAAEALGTFRAVDLADALKVKLPNLHQRLTALREAGVISRTPDPTAQRGRRHDYSVVNADLLSRN